MSGTKPVSAVAFRMWGSRDTTMSLHPHLGGLVAPAQPPVCLQLPSGAFVSRPLHSQSSDPRPVCASPLPLASTGVHFSGCFCPHCGVGHSLIKGAL